MPKAEWIPRAKKQLAEITYYIAHTAGRPAAGRKLAADLFEKTEQYARQPLMGTERPNFGKAIRSFSHKRYVVFYVPTDAGIEVRAVIDGARDYGALFFD